MKRKNNKSTFKLVLLILPSLVLLSSCDANALKEDLNTIGNKLVPNVWAFIVQFAALIVMLLIVAKLAYKPVHKFISERKKFLASEAEETKKALEDAKIDKEIAHKSVEDAKSEANEIIKKAELDAKKRGDNIILEAQNEANDIKQKSIEEIETAKARAFGELNAEIVDVAIDASSKILEREVSKEDNSKIVEDFLKELNKDETK